MNENDKRPLAAHNFDCLYDKNYYSGILYTNHFSGKNLSYRIIEDCTITPYNFGNGGGIFDRDGNYIRGSSYIRRNEDGVSGTSDTTHEPSKDSVIFIGTLANVWGHFITDSMSMLWFLKSRAYTEKFSRCRLVYLPAQGFVLKGNHKRLLEILGINLSMLEPVTTAVKYKNLILPDECFFKSENGIFFTPEYRGLADAVRNFALDNIRPTKHRKYYFSYSRYKSNRSIGEDKLEKYFASKGYGIVYPEKLSLDEQLNILINCDSFASTLGSCAHNVIFLKDRSQTVIIPRYSRLNSYQQALDDVHDLDINYVDSSFSIFKDKNESWKSPSLYFVSSNLRRFFNDSDTGHIISVSDFRKYIRTVKGIRADSSWGCPSKADNPDTYRYYSTIASEYFGYVFSQGWLCRFRRMLDNMKKAAKKIFRR